MNKRQKKKRETRMAARTRVLFNTGTVVHAPKKGRGSYKRAARRKDAAGEGPRDAGEP